MHPLFENIKAWLIEQLTGKPPAAAPARATAAPDQIGHDHDHDHAQSIVPFDENLLERSRTQWQFGDWDSLAKLDRDTLQHHPDRAKLALLAAAGHAQKGDSQAARQFTRLAQDWGCSKKLIGQILIAGVHNSIGRSAAIAGRKDRALSHFETAIALGAEGSAVRLLAQARTGQQLQQLGLLAGIGGTQKQVESKKPTQLAQTSDAAATRGEFTGTTFSPEAYEFYKDLAHTNSDRNSPAFILLDSKSLPRSGLHYMKRTFARLLGDDFSFCEWYQEPGCCKKMPCALTGYAQHCTKTNTSKLRLTKSHDFDLTDPTFLANARVRRLILVRDPLFILTSWFAMDQLMAYRTELLRSGINMEKIWLSHEPEVLDTAYKVLDNAFVAPSAEVLARWLAEKTRFISGFHQKWVTPALASPAPFARVVPYEEINSFIAVTVAELRARLPADAQRRIDVFAENHASEFKTREDPFHAPSPRLSSFLAENSQLFIETTNQLVLYDQNGIPK
jgi:hypothetical protein